MAEARIQGIEKPVSRLILGSVMFKTEDLPFAFSMLDHFRSLGGNAVDTAYSYGSGDCERAVGAWLAERGQREEVVIVGKGAHPENGRVKVTPEDISSDLETSLERLGTSYIDLYLLHRDDPARPVGEIVECLHGHWAAGRIHAYGGSNWSPERIDEANAYAREHGLTPFAASSPNFSLAVTNGDEVPWDGCRSATVRDRDWFIKTQTPLLSWSSQAQGFFSGRFSPEDRSNADMVRVWYSDGNFERLRRARELATARGVTPTTVALAYVLAQPFPLFALIGPANIDELSSSYDALKLTLSPDDLRWLNLES